MTLIPTKGNKISFSSYFTLTIFFAQFFIVASVVKSFLDGGGSSFAPGSNLQAYRLFILLTALLTGISLSNICPLMDYLHYSGVDTILKVQDALSEKESFMLMMSRAGDPRNAFLVYFPLVYSLSSFHGRRLMWAAVLSEWLNIVFKWLLFGHRPYWWIHEFDHGSRLQVQQYPLTCETGPGSPSGHAMVTAAVYYIIAHAAASKMSKWIPYLVMCMALIPISLARVFIATHFPHQVVAGTICGMIISIILDLYTAVHKWTLATYLKVAGALFFSCLVFSWTLGSLGVDLHWTIPLAYRWCKNAKDWVSLDTAPYNSLVRDVSVLSGFGISEALLKKNHAMLLSAGWTVKCIHAIKHTLIPLLVVYLVPSLLQKCLVTRKSE